MGITGKDGRCVGFLGWNCTDIAPSMLTMDVTRRRIDICAVMAVLNSELTPRAALDIERESDGSVGACNI